MPLKRGSDGSLGVQLYGDTAANNTARAGAPISVHISQPITLTGAMTTDDVVNTVKAAAQQTMQQMRRDVPAIVAQYDRDGALS